MLSIPEKKETYKIQNDKVFLYRYIFKGIRCARCFTKTKLNTQFTININRKKNNNNKKVERKTKYGRIASDAIIALENFPKITILFKSVSKF